jgi:hypothetical protein
MERIASLAAWESFSVIVGSSAAALTGLQFVVISGPVLEDSIWHTVLPAIAYVALLVAGIAAKADGRSALFVIGGGALLLLYVGIHNAWDAVVYIAIARRKERGQGRNRTDRA